MGYLIIVPMKNEEHYIKFILESIINQSYKPSLCIISNDGSTDKTQIIAEELTKGYNFFKIINIDNQKEKRTYGAKVIRAFNEGLKNILIDNYDFIVKLDADLSLPNDYFENINNAFLENKKLGICGGIIIEKEGDFEKKINASTYIQGAIKSIRKECFSDIGGLREINGWDGFDQLYAMYKGWKIKNLPIEVFHHRPEGKEYISLKFYFNNGLTHYSLGNNLLITIIRTIFHVKKKPYFIASLVYLMGFMKGFLFVRKRYVSQSFARFTNNYQYKRILKKNNDKNSINS